MHVVELPYTQVLTEYILFILHLLLAFANSHYGTLWDVCVTGSIINPALPVMPGQYWKLHYTSSVPVKK